MKDVIKFVDAQEMGRLNPDTFEVPTTKELDTITEGAIVKISANSERFWVEVTSVDGDTITGTVDNDLVLQPEDGINYGDIITFNKNNVYSIF